HADICTPYPVRGWSRYYRSVAVLGDFVKTRWDRFERDLQRVLPTTEEAIKKELKELVALIEYRPGVMSEALAQRKNIEVYWKVLPEVLRTPADPANPTNQTDPEDESTPLLRLARRVARNREVMGLHYRSDTRAGRILAEKTAPLLLGLSCVVEIVEKACEEWTDRKS